MNFVGLAGLSTVVDGSVIATVITSLTGAGVVGGVINFFLNRKKLGADTTKVISEAASSLVDPLTKRVDQLEADQAATRRVLRMHEPWDREVVRALASAEPPILIRDPPPLYPEDVTPDPGTPGT